MVQTLSYLDIVWESYEPVKLIKTLFFSLFLPLKVWIKESKEGNKSKKKGKLY